MLNLELRELRELLELLLRMVLLLWGSRFILTETAGLGRTVDLTQCVQCLALSVLQQVRLALRVRKKKRLSAKHQQIHTRLKKITKQNKKAELHPFCFDFNERLLSRCSAL